MEEKETFIYQPYILKIPMLDTEVLIRNVELLSSETSEFKHVHNSFEIYYAIEGDLKISISDKESIIPSGNFLLLGPGTWHGTVYEPDIKRKYFIMIFDILENDSNTVDNIYSESEILELQKILVNLNTRGYYIIKDTFNCQNTIEQMSLELKNKNLGWHSILSGLYVKFIILCLRNIIPATSFNLTKQSQANVNLAISITKYMHNHYSENITLQEIAKEMHVSPRHITRVFEACFGTTFSKTLSVLRLNYAKNYLYKTDYSIEKIATLVGFSSSRTLLRLFKEIEGITTTQYREIICNTKKQLP